jgi:membrane protein DedA with SNARE-associated domain
MLPYILTFVLLAFTGFGLALPEESILLLAAYFGATGSSVWYLLLAAVLGIAFADTMQYVRGRYNWMQFRGFKRGRSFIAGMGFFAVLISRFFITARVVVPYMAGAMRMPRFPFHLASLFGAIISSAIIIIGGGWFYSVLAKYYPAYAVAVWFGMVLVLTGVLIMHGTRNKLQLLQKK